MNLKLFLGRRGCILTKANILHIKPGGQSTFSSLFTGMNPHHPTTMYPNSYSCTHLSGGCPVKPVLLFFPPPFLATEQLCSSSLGSATEGITSTRIAAECFTHSVPPHLLPGDFFFHPVRGLKPVTFKAHSRFSDLTAPVALTCLTVMIPVRTFLQIYVSQGFISPPLSLVTHSHSQHTIFFGVHWRAADQNIGVPPIMHCLRV